MDYRDLIRDELLKNLPQRQFVDAGRVSACNLSIAWWNTSLNSYSPQKKKLSPVDVRSTITLIYNLIEQNDIVILGEYLDEYGIKQFLREKNVSVGATIRNSYDVVDLGYEDCEGRKFHNFLIYDSRKVSYRPESISMQTANRIKGKYYRVFQCVRFDRALPGGAPLELYIVHWSMRDAVQGDLERRNKNDAASMLCERMLIRGEFPFKMIVGDFNVEPYEQPFLEMRSSRSSAYALRTENLYNPFWRFLHDAFGTISANGNESFHCDVPIFDSFVVNHEFLRDENSFDLTPLILNTDSRLFSRAHHRPVRLTISRKDRKI